MTTLEDSRTQVDAAAVHPKRFDTTVTLAALGVVFGDIGTSPLYAFKTCFSTANVAPTPENVFGIVSLIVWALILVVCVKYISIVMRVTHDGEGGILALLALLLPHTRRAVPPAPTWVTLVVIVGAAMLFGDGVITPAISVLSAVEGLNVATTAAQPLIVPITLVILFGLFFIQSRGTEAVGRLFGPIMLAWFLAIALAGIVPILGHPAIVGVLDPRHAAFFLTHHGIFGFLVLGATVLCVTGVEALYADLSHFGQRPITISWYALVFPALLLNYAGQGARVLADPHALDAPFYALVPGPLLVPMVVLATLATVIASQALISGAFTLTEQAIALNLAPRVEVRHTSHRYPGQVYVPAMRMLLGIACGAIVIGFRSSDKLAAAYGLAVAVTMMATSIAYVNVVYRVLHWKRIWAYALGAFFLTMDSSFVFAGLPKFFAGGWLPIGISVVLTAIATTWLEGRRRFFASLLTDAIPIDAFVKEMRSGTTQNVSHAVLLTGDASSVPYLQHQQWVRDHIVDESVVLLTVLRETEPRVRAGERVTVERLAPGLTRVTAKFGYIEPPRLHAIVSACATNGLHIDAPSTSFFVGAARIVARSQAPRMPGWRRSLFAALLGVSRPLTDDLGVPANQLIELGVEVPL